MRPEEDKRLSPRKRIQGMLEELGKGHRGSTERMAENVTVISSEYSK